MSLQRALRLVMLALGLVTFAGCDLGGSAPLTPTAVLPSPSPVATLGQAPGVATATEANGGGAPSPVATPTTTVAGAPPPSSATAPASAATQASGAPPVAYLVYSRLDGSLWRADGAGQAPIPIAPPSEPQVILPWAASPDGRLIAYVSGTGVWDNSPPGTPPALALWMVNADGTNRRQIVDLLPPSGVDTTPGGADEDLIQALTTLQEPAWSPDGSRVAFISAQDEEVDLYTATADGAVTRLTQTDSLKKSPRWSPDGSRVAVMTTSGFGTGAGWADAGILVAPVAGGAPVRAVPDLKLADGKPATFLSELLWVGPDTLVAALQAVPSGGAEAGMLTVSSGAWAAIVSAPTGEETGLWWSAADSTLAIAVTPGTYDETQPDTVAGLYLWKPGAGAARQVTSGVVGPISQSPQQTLAVVGPAAWRAQGGALAYNIVGNSAQLGVRVVAPGAAGAGMAITATAGQDVLWAPDGQRLAVDAGIYRASGQAITTLPAVNTLLGWAPQGLFYTTENTASENDETGTLWIWNGGAPVALDPAVGAFSFGRVVWPGR